jgi:3-hydroxyisobutyrate dehydrogenase-like beta-hydroxyacid dehydrogenase
MEKCTIGILHPGAMGSSIAAAAAQNGHEVYWASNGRSTQSQKRAKESQLLDASSVKELCQKCSVILSVCPPHAAEDMAEEIVSHGFAGLYVDANAIAPQRTLRIEQILKKTNANLVDGGIIGGPAWGPGKTFLHLSGARAEEVANLLATDVLNTNVLSAQAGDASSLKMCFAAYTKGSTALVCAIVASAKNLGVRDALFAQWSQGNSDMASKSQEQIRNVTNKAWRFSGEMREISSTFVEAGMPGGFHEAAAAIYERIAHFKDADETPSFEEVLSALTQEDER